MDWFFLLNEEGAYDPHHALGEPDQTLLSGGARSVVFNVPSPVQTVDGVHAATFLDGACLWVSQLWAGQGRWGERGSLSKSRPSGTCCC